MDTKDEDKIYDIRQTVGMVFQSPDNQICLLYTSRIHPARIEETVEKCRHDLELQMKREGERAVMELGIHGLHPTSSSSSAA